MAIPSKSALGSVEQKAVSQAADGTIKVYVGTDRSQYLALSVLEDTIRTTTEADVEIRSLADLGLPAPPDPQHRARTGFSFARFAIPALNHYAGRAIYLDADMLVLRDIQELWSMDLSGAFVGCQEDIPAHVAATAPAEGTIRKKQCSVMLLDCDNLDWDASKIIAGLGPNYTYEQLMEELCILPEDAISYNIPTHWNSLEHYDDQTSLIHFTDMMTQPWVDARNANGWLWVNALKDMLARAQIDLNTIRHEIELNYVRPSLLEELKHDSNGRLSSQEMTELHEFDIAHGFVAHAALRRALPPHLRLLAKIKRSLGM